MPDALNHLASYNRIALALENMKQSDMAALVTAIENLVNKPASTITVSPANPTITVSPAAPAITVSPANPTITVAPANPTITVNAGDTSGTGGAGSLDCSCLANAFAPLIQKIDDLICVNAAATAAAIQQAKILAYMMKDGPGMGIDAPPGSFVFPDPGDSSPPQITTPWPDDGSTIPGDTGGWTSPPIVGGCRFNEPPGGMQGLGDPKTYSDYKCDVAAFLYQYVVDWYNAVINFISAPIGSFLDISTATTLLMGTIQSIGGLSALFTFSFSEVVGGIIIVGAGSVGVVIEAPALAVGIAAMTAFAAACVVLRLGGIAAATPLIAYRDRLVANKHAIICGLYKSKTVGAARENLNSAIAGIPPEPLGYNGEITNYFLSDMLLAQLFACQEGLNPDDFKGLGAQNGGCVSCVICTDMDNTVGVGLKSIYGYPAPTNETRTGLVPYPIKYSVTLNNVEAICITLFSENKNNGGGADRPGFTIKLFKQGLETVIVAGGAQCSVSMSNQILLRCLTLNDVPQYWTGQYYLLIYCEAAWGGKPPFTFETFGYKEAAP